MELLELAEQARAERRREDLRQVLNEPPVEVTSPVPSARERLFAPAVDQVQNLDDLAAALVQLRRSAGNPSWDKMAKTLARGEGSAPTKNVPASTLRDAVRSNRRRGLRLEVLTGFLAACHVDQEHWPYWEDLLFRALQRETRTRAEFELVMEAGYTTDHAEPVPQRADAPQARRKQTWPFRRRRASR